MGFRFLYLVRHGQYNMEKEAANYGSLTKLGHYQSVCIAKRLKEYPIDVIHSSSVNRAKETALAVMEKFSGAKLLSHQLLKEGLPYVPTAIIKERNLDKQAIKLDKERMTQAYAKFFVPNKKKESKHEALICHGNIIRYFMCRALGVPIEAWTKFEIYECSLTIIKIKEDGKSTVISFGDIGHIPREKRTVL